MAETKKKKTQSIKSVEKTEPEKKPKERITAKQFVRQMKLGIGIDILIENWLGRTKGIAFPHTVKKTAVEWQKILINMNRENA